MIDEIDIEILVWANTKKNRKKKWKKKKKKEKEKEKNDTNSLLVWLLKKIYFGLY